MIQHKLEATDGWMSPKGEFYPCYLHEHNDEGWFSAHGVTALKIVRCLYEDEILSGITSTINEAQDFLLDNGWMRVDIESIITYYATEYQKQALEKMLKMQDTHDGFCRKCADLILSE